jgi:hypothetical protein
MEYRTNRRTGDRISVIGLGTSYIAETEEKEAVGVLEFAHEKGINYADLATADAKTFTYYGKAFSSVRKDMHYQVHFGANYERGAYGWRDATCTQNPFLRVHYMALHLLCRHILHRRLCPAFHMHKMSLSHIGYHQAKMEL